MIQMDPDLVADEDDEQPPNAAAEVDEIWDRQDAAVESGAESEIDYSDSSDIETYFNAGV